MYLTRINRPRGTNKEKFSDGNKRMWSKENVRRWGLNSPISRPPQCPSRSTRDL